jgi:hypothetical protein
MFGCSGRAPDFSCGTRALPRQTPKLSDPTATVKTRDPLGGIPVAERLVRPQCIWLQGGLLQGGPALSVRHTDLGCGTPASRHSGFAAARPQGSPASEHPGFDCQTWALPRQTPKLSDPTATVKTRDPLGGIPVAERLVRPQCIWLQGGLLQGGPALGLGRVDLGYGSPAWRCGRPGSTYNDPRDTT